MRPFREEVHIDPETDSPITERWYIRDGTEYREVLRPAGLPATALWTRLTANLDSKVLALPIRVKPLLPVVREFVPDTSKPPRW